MTKNHEAALNEPDINTVVMSLVGGPRTSIWAAIAIPSSPGSRNDMSSIHASMSIDGIRNLKPGVRRL